MQKYNFFLKQQTFVYTNFKFSPKKRPNFVLNSPQNGKKQHHTKPNDKK